MAFPLDQNSRPGISSGDSDLCCVELLCAEEDVQTSCVEEVEVHEVNEADEWLMDKHGDAEAIFEGALVDPNTQELVETKPSAVVGCQSYVSSTELIESESPTAMESVESYLQPDRSVTPNGDEDDEENSMTQASTVKRVILLNPGDDPDTATAKAISDITDSLNKRAAERLAAGKTPEKETVIEITRIKAPYLSKESVIQAERERLASNYINAASHRAPASSAILQGRKGSSTSIGAPTPPQHHQHHRRKSPHPKKTMYSPTPPCVPKPQQQDLSDGCYFVSSAKIHQNSASSKLRTVNASSDLKCSEGRLAPGTALYAAPSPCKGPNILRNRSGLKQGLPKLKVTTKACKPAQNENSAASSLSLTNIELLGSYSAQASKSAELPPQKPQRDYRRIIANDKQLDQVSRECGVSKRPPYSYMHLIEMAICSREDKRMTLKEIYGWIENKFAFYKHSTNQGWKNSIRHNLSLYDIFVREKRSIPGKTGSSFWTLRSDHINKSSRSIRSMIAEVEASSAEERNGISSDGDAKPKKGQVRLLPKPPANDNQAYAIIPIQNGVPVIPSQPLMVSSWQLASSPQLILQDNNVVQNQGLSTPPKAGFRGHRPSKASLKRNRSPHEFLEGSSRKQAKRASRVNAFGEWRRCSSAASSSAASSSDLGRSWDTSDLQQQFSQIKVDSGIDVSSSFSEETVSSLPKPTLYPVANESDLLSLYQDDEEDDDSGLQDILNGIEKDLSTPMRRLLQTPTKTGDNHFFSSTPFKKVFGSPCWSPIEGLAPIDIEETDLNPQEDNRTSTPFSPCNASPKGCLSPISLLRDPRINFEHLMSDVDLDDIIKEEISEADINLDNFQ